MRDARMHIKLSFSFQLTVWSMHLEHMITLQVVYLRSNLVDALGSDFASLFN